MEPPDMMDPANPLAAPQQQAQDPMPLLSKAHDMAAALFAKTGAGLKHLTTLNEALAKLSKLGDTVTEEDIVKSASNLVATGTHSANEMASILAGMPQGGKGIAAWVQQHLEHNIATTQQLTQLHTLARHEMGASGLRLMANAKAPQANSPAPPQVM